MQHPDGGIMMPYLDGGTQKATLRNGYVEIESDGDLDCTNTDGTVKEDSIGDCEDCDRTVREDDNYGHVGRCEDRLVCSCCMENYSRVQGAGRHGTREYYVYNDIAVEVGGEWYDGENLPDFIVQLEDGELAHQDDAVFIKSCSEYYLVEDEAVCTTADGDWELRDRCVKCDDGEWRLENDCVVVDGEWYEEGTEPTPEEDETQMELPLGETT
jgi:hypothetical protein